MASRQKTPKHLTLSAFIRVHLRLRIVFDDEVHSPAELNGLRAAPAIATNLRPMHYSCGNILQGHSVIRKQGENHACRVHRIGYDGGAHGAEHPAPFGRYFVRTMFD